MRFGGEVGRLNLREIAELTDEDDAEGGRDLAPAGGGLFATGLLVALFFVRWTRARTGDSRRRPKRVRPR